jgi:hypothetical protein
MKIFSENNCKKSLTLQNCFHKIKTTKDFEVNSIADDAL